ncbi:DRC10 protein, partial [Geococcyx californianus]|nr:DRC10 protein [Geococcyx californianus]
KGIAAPETEVATLNAMKMLEPSQLKSERVQAERIITILDGVIDKLEMRTLVPHITASLDTFAVVLGPEITNILTEHQKLSDEIKNLLSGLEEGDAVRGEAQRGCLCLVEHRLKASVRNILTLLLDNPQLCQALKYRARVRGAPAEEFIKAFREIRNFMVQRLLTSSEEEEEKSQFMDSISFRVKKNSEAITALEAELAAAIRTQEEEIQKKDNMIKDLQTSMQVLTKEYEAVIQQIKEEGEKQQEEEPQASQARCAVLEQDIKGLRAQLKALVLEDRASELALRKSNCRLETEVVNWMQEYDTDMGENQAEFEEVDAAYTEEKAQLSLLMEKHALLLQEYSSIEEARRISQEKKEKALKELAIRNLAASRIQAFWRDYLVRSHLKSKMKGKGEGKNENKVKGKGKGKNESK